VRNGRFRCRFVGIAGTGQGSAAQTINSLAASVDSAPGHQSSVYSDHMLKGCKRLETMTALLTCLGIFGPFES
jgi:hypothetical protein